MTRVLISIAMLCSCSVAWSDDTDDIMEFVEKYSATEADLQTQAELIRDDRIMIAGGVRQTDQDMNMAVQQAERDHRAELAGGPAKWIVGVEDPIIRVYGKTAVASYVRLTSIFPPGEPPISAPPQWITLVLVKEDGDWGIAHNHVSVAGANN